MKVSSGESAGQLGAVPEAWFGSEAQKAFQQRLRSASARTLLLDYDGTLAPFHADKMRALPYRGVATILERLRLEAGVRIVLVTGRRAADLEHLLEIAGQVEIWGSHGREHINVGREYTFYPPTAEQSAALDTLQAGIEASLAGQPLERATDDAAVLEPLERKPASLAVHWRGLAAESQARLQAIAERAYGEVERLGPGTSALERLPFASGVEFRAAGCTKAFAVERVLATAPENGVAAYLGDDLTDEDAFVAMARRGLSVLVRPERRSSNARFWLRPPGELLRFLEDWCAPLPARDIAQP